MLTITEGNLGLPGVVQVARERARVALSDSVRARMDASRRWVDEILASDRPVYGINTGFGELSKIFISPQERETLQRNLILSHCSGVGPHLPEDVVRAAMLLRVNSLARGYSGIRTSTVQMLVELLNRDIYPVVPAKGSVGASGDLAPLSHMAAVLLGEGSVVQDGRIVPSGPALRAAGLSPLSLAGKEGLALINGTQVMTAVAALVCHDAIALCKIADVAAALSLEALRGTRTAFDPRIAAVRPYPGQRESADNVLALTQGSQIIQSHIDCDKVQDAYSLRCVPQVHGASRDALRRALETLRVEMNAVTDNPLVMPDTGEILSGGNFHGQPVALVMDHLKVALSELGNISERRINRLVDPNLSALPSFLTAYPGVNSGFMILQYTAASLVSENKVLAHPASADSIPTSANQEDHVSMGTIAARQAREILDNVKYVLAIELMAAAQGVDFLAPMAPGAGTAAAHRHLRTLVPRLEEDRILTPDILAVRRSVTDGSLLAAVEAETGALRSVDP
ncbi:MAG: histidine ammonia-lyase [Oscillospiraceae bacterium]|jgi:histidine ammonia-lyase|nr:histidine ammonia-lyase [Oscillospiraceae bacterium]